MSKSEFLLKAWDWKLSALAGCGVLLALYARWVGLRFDRRTMAWLTGVGLLLLALVSPLNELAEHYLFSAHMARHILFVLVIPAFLLMGLPTGRGPHYRGVGTGWAAGVGVMILWHIPALFEAACSHPALRTVEDLSLLLGGTVFWLPILGPVPEARLSPVPQGIGYLFSACLACTGMGVLITFSNGLLYPAYAHPVDPYGILPAIRNGWGISPAMDQQIGGLLMWVPACLIYLTAIMALFARWYAEESHKQMETQWT